MNNENTLMHDFRRYLISSGNFTNSESPNINSFLERALSLSICYDRGVGYFSSGWLSIAASGVAAFAANGGRARWVTSPILSEADWTALYSGDQAKVDETLKKSLEKAIQELEHTLQHDTLTALSWMIADGILDFRLAVPREKLSGGEFHDKFGIFTDGMGNRISFNGSCNDSIQGFRNYESIKVFCSWELPFSSLVDADALRFEKLWNNQDPNVRVYLLPEAARSQILKLRPAERPYPISTGITAKLVSSSLEAEVPTTMLTKADVTTESDASGKSLSEGTSDYSQRLVMPQQLLIRDYQREAIREWSANDGRGVLAMATGTGKTITALALATKVTERNPDRPFVFIILCPYINLCRQWEGELLNFGVQAIGCYEGRARWETLFDEAYQRIHAKLVNVAAFVVTNATFQSDAFQFRLKARLAAHSVTPFIIADEVHNLGAKGVQSCLPPEIKLRLALSATPDRHLDPEGSQAILNYFGKIIYTFPLGRAIAEGYLTQYEYHPILVTLSQSEAEQYWLITQQLSRLLAGGKGDGLNELDEGAMHLLIKRARLIGAAADKITQLDLLLKRLPEKPRRALFYCGDGRTGDTFTKDDKRQIEDVAHLLGNHHHLRVRTFTYQEKTTEREDVLRDLRSGFLDGVVAIRCLDEGIDLPALDTGFLLASSSNPRQFVQRRGRLLRKAKGKDKAVIYDFVVVPPAMDGDVNDHAFNLERRLFQSELKRISEFCQTALNGFSALEILAPLRKHYNLIAA